MILTDQPRIDAYTAMGVWGSTALDQLVSKHAAAHPDRVALADPPNRKAVDGRAPERLTWAELDASVTSVAAALRTEGLGDADVVALQLPNTVDAPIAFLGVLRAGLIACPLPLLWRRQEIAAALGRVAPRAILTVETIDGHAHADMMRYAAAEVFSVRRVLSLHAASLDGVVALTAGDSKADLLDLPDGERANHVATMCFGLVDEDPLTPVPRSHNQWISAATLHLLTARLTAKDSILATQPATHLTALASTWGPWLLAGARLVLHHPFDRDVLLAQIDSEKTTYAVLPAAVADALTGDGVLKGTSIKQVGCVWPFAERARGGWSAETEEDGPEPIDIYGFGEIATYAGRRSARLKPGILPVGKIVRPEGSADGLLLLETGVQGGLQKASSVDIGLSGELVLAGPMLPDELLSSADKRMRAAKGTRKGPTRPGRVGVVGSGIFCALAAPNAPLAILGANEAKAGSGEAAIICHGGVRMSASELDALYASCEGFEDAAAVGLADPLMGERLWAAVVPSAAGAASLEALASHLHAQGVAPYKVPERLVPVGAIPRLDDGTVARAELLKQL